MPSAIRLLVSCFFIACVTHVYAADAVILDAPVNGIDRRNDYTDLLLSAILRKTEAKYGHANIRYAPEYMYRDRLLAELKKGVKVTVTAKATRPDWEESGLLTIRIPVDKGITEYRLFLINKDDQSRFSAITKLEELKQLKLGVGHAWSSRAVFEANGFQTESVVDWEGMYRMLTQHRFNYFPRALSEIFVEYDDREKTFPSMGIENSIAVYFPLPKYFFVSPEHPRLAKRIREGFEAMITDGSFDRLFFSYHKPLIERADFCHRRLFKFSNPFLSPLTPLNKPEYWYDPYTQRTGSKIKPLCLKDTKAG